LSATSPLAFPAEEVPPLPEALDGLERRRIEEALRKCGGIQARAARLLGITQIQNGYKIKKWGIEVDL